LENPEHQISLREYLAVLRVRKWTIILCVVLITGAAVGFSAMQTPLYSAETRVLVEPIAGESTTFNPLLPVDISTQVELIASESVAALVREDLNLDKPIDSLLRGLSVTPQGETQVVNITYTSPDPEEARNVAQSFADNYIEFRREQALSDVVAEEEGLQQQVQSASEQLTTINEDIANAQRTGDAALAASLETQRSVLISRLGVLQQQLDNARAERSQSSDAGQIIEPALLPDSPSSPNHLSNGLMGIFLGVALGIALAFLRERLDDRFRDRSDLEKTIEAPVLATVPRYAIPKKDQSPLVSISQSSVGAVEAYRSLRTNLQFITSQRNLKSVLLTSPSESEGKSATTANLGVLLAQAGRRVILISSDLRRPTLGGYFGVREGHDDETGLSSWLASQDEEPWDVIKDPGIPNLRVIPSGPLPPNPSELLTSPRAEALIRVLEANCDLVLCDSPPVLAVADAAELASVVGGSVLVVNAGSTHKSATVHARQELERVGGRLIGAVLNGFDPSTSPYYSSPYTSYTATAPAEPGNGKQKGRKRRFLSKR
jgi:succinoglycan biosynthesis transport protein ExoP